MGVHIVWPTLCMVHERLMYCVQLLMCPGPRFVLNPIRVFRNSFGGETLYQNPRYQSPNEVLISFA